MKADAIQHCLRNIVSDARATMMYTLRSNARACLKHCFFYSDNKIKTFLTHARMQFSADVIQDQERFIACL